MDDRARRRRNTVQNIAIVLLSLSAVLLFTQTQLYNLEDPTGGSYFGQLVGGGTTAPATTATRLTDLSVPVRVAVTDAYGRYGDLCLTTTAEDFAALGTTLGVALGSAGVPIACTETDFRTALSGTSVYYDFTTPLPLSVLAGLVGADHAGSGSARRVLLTLETDGSVLLYLWDGNETWTRCTTAVTEPALTELVGSYELGTASFALDNAELLAAYDVGPYSLFVAELPALPVLYAANTLTATDALLTALGFNPHTNFRYAESDGTVVIREGDSALRLQGDGTLLYESGPAPALQIAGGTAQPTPGEAAVGADALLNSLLAGSSGNAALYLEGVQQSGTETTLTFGYQSGGVPIRLSGGRHAAEMTLDGNAVVSFSLYFRQYTATEQTALLLPLRQAVAIAAGYGETELTIGYADNGEDTVSASWLAD